MKKVTLQKLFIQSTIKSSLIQVIIVLSLAHIGLYYFNKTNTELEIRKSLLTNDEISQIEQYHLTSNRDALDLYLIDLKSSKNINKVKIVGEVPKDCITEVDYSMCGRIDLELYQSFTILKDKFVFFSVERPTDINPSYIYFFCLMLFIFNLISSYIANIFARIEIKRQIKDIKESKAEGVVRIEEFEEINKIVSKGLRNKIDEEISNSNYKIIKKLQHDIQSPLTSLEYFFSEAKCSLSEDLRSVGKQSIDRILDIVNSLKINDNHSLIKESTKSDTVAIFPILKRIVSEKRNEFKKRSDISINLTSQSESDYFINIKKSDFYRTISNIINNSVEAKHPKRKLVISVSIERIGTEVAINIRDNGVGISPENLPNVFEYGKSYSKNTGSGIGLFQAKEYVESEKGTMAINSNSNEGTLVSIKLNTTSAPSWYQNNLRITKYNVIIIDDDDSIFNLWRKRLSSENLNLKHIKSSEDFDSWIMDKQDLINYDFLFDLELLGSKKDGIELINKYKLQSKSTLVTSHFMDKEIQKRCIESNIKMIPKESVATIKVKVSNNSSKESSLKEVVLIDDDQLVHSTWEMVGATKNYRVYCYYDIETFLSESKEYNKNTPIYIDSNLGDHLKGEIESKKIYDKGFNNLFISTGSKLNNLPYWIKSQQGKEFPLH